MCCPPGFCRRFVISQVSLFTFRAQVQLWLGLCVWSNKQRPSGSVRRAPGSYKVLRDIPALYANGGAAWISTYSCSFVLG